MTIRIFLLLISLFSPLVTKIVSAQEAEATPAKEERFCVGFLWCTEKKEGLVTTDALLYLYSSEERTGFSRLAIRPFYSHEIDQKRDSLRRSILWPLGTYERKGQYRWSHLFPLYFSGSDRKADDPYSFRYIFPSYGKDTNEKRSRQFFFPLAGSEEIYVPKENRISLLGLPPIESFAPLPTLALYEHATLPEGVTDRFFLLYRYERERRKEALRISVIGHSPLSLFWYNADAGSTETHLFPLYSYEANKKSEAYWFGVLGYNELSFYWHRSAPALVTDRLFPLYDYQVEGEDHTLSLIGLSELSLYRQRITPSLTAYRISPLFNYRHDRLKGETEWNVALLYNHLSTATSVSDFLFPLYNYEQNSLKKEWELGVLGTAPLSIYRHRSTPTETGDHLFPLYGYRHFASEGTNVSILGFPPGDRITFAFYAHADSSENVTDRFFPLYSYKNQKGKEQELGILGWGRFSLYRSLKTETTTSNRLVPIYSYASDSVKEEAEGSLLWPLVNVKSKKGKMVETSMLWWLFNYEHPDEGHRAFRVLGGSAMAVVRKETTPTRFLFEFNPILPFYSYESEKGKESEWNLLGGLVGVRTEGDQKKVRLFFIYF